MSKYQSTILGILTPLLFFISLIINAQLASNGEKKYNAHYVNKPPVIDGKLNDKQWEKSSWENQFEDIEGANKTKPYYATQFNIVWDSNYLYVAAYLQEPDIWATKKNRDDIIYHDHDFELFLDPNNDGENYFEFEINALGTLMDLLMSKPYKKGGTYNLKWDAAGIKYAVFVEGTINNNTDKDKGWSVEMAIPFSALKVGERNYLPSVANPWRLNFSRVEWVLLPQDNSYQKKKDALNKPLPEFNWVWSPTGLIDIHVPNKWGLLYFTK